MNQDMEQLVRSYKFTVLALSLLIVAMFAAFMFVVLVYVPDIIARSNVEALDPLIRSAIDDEFQAQIESTNAQ